MNKTAEKKQTRTFKLIREQNTSNIEDDFVLEKEGDISAFLCSTNKSQSMDYRPFAMVGPQSPKEVKPRPVQKSRLQRNSTRGVHQHLDPKTAFTLKLSQIEEAKAQALKDSKQKLKHMLVGQRIVSQRESKILQGFLDTQRNWNRIESSLAKRLRKEPGELLSNRAYEFRERCEEMDFIDRQVPSREKAGDKLWYMTLRGNKKFEYFQPVGCRLNELYAVVKDRRHSAEAVVRRHVAKTANKTFRDSEWFQKKSQQSKRLEIDPNELKVIGVPKLPMEVNALQLVGTDQLDLTLIDPPATPEVYESQYDPALKIKHDI